MADVHFSGHVLVVSFPGQGHVNPLLRFAKRVAAKGLLVTFSSTADIALKLHQPSTNYIPIGDGLLRFDFFSDGLDFDDPKRLDLDYFLPQLRNKGSLSFCDLVRRQADEGRPVSCIVGNPFFPWVLDVARDFNIPCAVLWVQSVAVFSTYFHYHHSPDKFPSEENPDVTISLPGLPALAADELPSFLLPSDPHKRLRDEILEQFHNISISSWVLANTFDELERDALTAITEQCRLIPVGPLIEFDEADFEIRINLWRAADCMDWLDAQKPCSVVYVSVGSVVVLTEEELREMAMGLKDAKRPFLWVVRETYKHLLPPGFVEETKEQGMVVPWTPQDRVLAHGAVGCFVTHCGWNSTLEVLANGVPVVAYPHWGDQMPDAKFLVDVYRVGVRLEKPAKREKMVRCVEAVMAGPEAEEMKKRAMEWKKAAKVAVAPGGSSDRNIQEFVDQISSNARCVREEAGPTCRNS